MEIFLLALVALIAINVWITRRILRLDLFGHHKMLLLIPVWALPFVGAFAAGIHTFGGAKPRISHDDVEDPASRELAPREIHAAAGEPFRILEHAAAPNGFPVLDWHALQTWADAQSDQSGSAALIDQGRKAWLLHLRDVLGPHTRLYETSDAYILSSLEPSVLKVTAEYVGKTRRLVTQVLEGMASFPPNEKSILLVLDSEADYYSYVSIYYPESGEFSFSGGMYIHFGCPHFVVVRADLSAIEPVIAHEMTHSALAHLRLPTWLDEGIAVNTEHRLTGAKQLIYTPREIDQMHRHFWNGSTIQEFWSGKSFQRTDSGNLLSYQLARTIVEQMARNWEAFREFALHASRDDAGAAAAQDILGVDLGAYAGALFQIKDITGWSPDAEKWKTT